MYSEKDDAPNFRRFASIDTQMVFPSSSVMKPFSIASIKISPVVICFNSYSLIYELMSFKLLLATTPPAVFASAIEAASPGQ